MIPLVYLTSAMVTFNDNNNGHYAVTLNTMVSPNAVAFNNSTGNYTLSGTSGIAGAGGLTKLGTGSVTLTTTNTYTGATNVSGGSLILAAVGALPSGTNLNIGTAASVVAENLGTRYALTVGSLAVTGKLDLNNNGLIVHNGSIGAVTSLLQSGYSGGGWNGSPGIVSTTAANNLSHLTAVGVVINDTGANASTGTPLYSTLDGAPTADGDILVKYTYYGDTNLDGKIDGTDYSRIDNAYLGDTTHPGEYTGWYNGDFNYDGVINGSDYTLIDNAFNAQGAVLSIEVASATAQLADTGAASSSVPEPTTLVIVAAGSTGLLCQRRGRKGISQRFSRLQR